MLKGKHILVTAGPTQEAIDPVRYLTNHSSGKMGYALAEAAVADFRPAEVADNKIKKNDSDSHPALALEETDDILGMLGPKKKKGQLLIGFSMETKDLIENSEKKLAKKNLDMVCANNLKEHGAGFQVDTNLLTLITKDGETSLPLMSKYDAANAILDRVVKMMK